MMKQVNFRIPLRVLTLLMGLMISISAFAQITVNGNVKDATGEPVIGASVRVVGTTIGTTTSRSRTSSREPSSKFLTWVAKPKKWLPLQTYKWFFKTTAKSSTKWW